MKSPIILDSSCNVTLRGRTYKNPCPTTAGYLLVDPRTNKEIEISHAQLHRWHVSGELRIRRDVERKVVKTAGKSRSTKGERREAAAELHRHRLFFVREFRKLEAAGETSRNEDDMQRAIALIDAAREGRKRRADREKKGHEPPTPRHLRRWLKSYAEGGTLALRSQRHRMGNRTARFAYQALQIMNRHVAAYADELRPTIRECYRAMVEEIETLRKDGVVLACPSLKSFSKRVRDENQFRAHARRYGADAAVAKFYGSKGGAGATKPLERCEIDDFQTDVFSLLGDGRILSALDQKSLDELQRVRYWMTAVIDAATRYVLAVIMTRTPTSDSALRALRMAMVDKSELAEAFGCLSRWEGGGRICELVADNGANFISADFVEACTTLGVTLTHTIAGRPQFRGIVERFSRTLSYETVARFSGRTFSNPVERGDYPSEQRAVLTPDELAEAIVRAIVDIYHNSAHRGLNGETPANAWRRLIEEYGAPPPPARVEMIVAFGSEDRRKTSIEGIVFNGIQYHSKKLQEHRLERGDVEVAIRVDHESLAEIAANLGGVWVEIPAVDQETAAVSLDRLKAENAYVAMKFAREARQSSEVVMATRRYLREKNLTAQRRARLIAPDPDERALRRAQVATTSLRDVTDVPALKKSRAELGSEIPTGSAEILGPTDSRGADPRLQQLLHPRGELGGGTIKE